MYLEINLKLISELFALASLLNCERNRFIGLLALAVEHAAVEPHYWLWVIVILVINLDDFEVAVLLVKEEVLAADVGEIYQIVCLLNLDNLLFIRIYWRDILVLALFVFLLFFFLLLLGWQQHGVVVPDRNELGAHIGYLSLNQQVRGAVELLRLRVFCWGSIYWFHFNHYYLFFILF